MSATAIPILSVLPQENVSTALVGPVVTAMRSSPATAESLAAATAINKGNLVTGRIVPGTISKPGERQVWSCPVTAGAVVEVQVFKTGGDATFNPEGAVTVKNSAGTVLIGRSIAANNGVVRFQAVAGGLYTVEVSDINGGKAKGSYTISYESLKPASPDARPLVLNTTLRDSIGQATERDQFTYVSRGNENLQLTLTKSSGGFIPQVEVISPSISQFNLQPTHVIFPPNGSEITVTLTLRERGTYVFQVSDMDFKRTGSYGIRLSRPKSVNAPGLALHAQDANSVAADAACTAPTKPGWKDAANGRLAPPTGQEDGQVGLPAMTATVKSRDLILACWNVDESEAAYEPLAARAGDGAVQAMNSARSRLQIAGIRVSPFMD